MERSKAVEWIIILYVIAWRVIRVYEEKQIQHLLFYCIEFFTGKRVEGKKMLISQQLGVIFLLLIFLIAVYNDILKL